MVAAGRHRQHSYPRWPQAPPVVAVPPPQAQPPAQPNTNSAVAPAGVGNVLQAAVVQEIQQNHRLHFRKENSVQTAQYHLNSMLTAAVCVGYNAAKAQELVAQCK